MNAPTGLNVRTPEKITRRLFLKSIRQHHLCMKKPSKHQIEKRLKRELKHVDWLEKNLRGSRQERDSRKRVLKLYSQRHGLICD